MPDPDRSSTDEHFDVIETQWIELEGRPRLAARIWLPRRAAQAPVPAILEFLPYRRRDGTAARDESTYPVFARAGYAGVRVDMRGSGDSDGLYDDEYSETELADAEAVIAWIAAQPWCSGSVGMMGISWGGINSLAVAARRPAALRAIVSIASSVDRYNDDIHYRHGCHLGAHLNWATTVLGYMSRPPDSDVVGERWRAMWLERLHALEPATSTWMEHQRRDDYWKRGSVCEDFAAIEVPTLLIAGWGDGYRNTPAKGVAGLKCVVKAINGPWIHKYPHFAVPRPRADFHAEALRWWDRWLAGEPNDAEQLPAQRAFIAENVSAYTRPDGEAGHWASRNDVADSTAQRRYLRADCTLASDPGDGEHTELSTAQTCGADGGVFFVVDPETELPRDQRADDDLALCFDTEPLAEAVTVLGRSRLWLRLASDQPVANLIARLEDVHPDGRSHRVALGMLNLAHRHSNESPRPLERGRFEDVELRLDDAGYRFLPGHRIRLALSTTYFPMVLPPPHPACLTLVMGANAYLDLPVPADLIDVDMAEPADGLLPQYPHRTAGFSVRTVSRDDERATVTIRQDSGETVHPTNGMVWQEIHESTSAIGAEDPLSVDCSEAITVVRRRAGVETRSVATGGLTATETEWVVAASIAAWENDQLVFERTWQRRIRRDLQ